MEIMRCMETNNSMANLDTEWFFEYTVIGQKGLSVVCENDGYGISYQRSSLLLLSKSVTKVDLQSEEPKRRRTRLLSRIYSECSRALHPKRVGLRPEQLV